MWVSVYLQSKAIRTCKKHSYWSSSGSSSSTSLKNTIDFASSAKTVLLKFRSVKTWKQKEKNLNEQAIDTWKEIGRIK